MKEEEPNKNCDKNNKETKIIKGENKTIEKENIDYVGQIIFKKYKITKKIGIGTQSTIYSGHNIITKEPIAIKVENQQVKDSLLRNEMNILYKLKKKPGIVNMITCGRNKNNFILVENLFGKSLELLFLDLSKKFNLFILINSY